MEATRMPLVKWGNSHGIRIPKKMLDALGLKEKDVLEVTLENEAILIKPSREKKSILKERIEAFYQKDFDKVVKEVDYDFEIVKTGGPVGDEVW